MHVNILDEIVSSLQGPVFSEVCQCPVCQSECVCVCVCTGEVYKEHDSRGSMWAAKDYIPNTNNNTMRKIKTVSIY